MHGPVTCCLLETMLILISKSGDRTGINMEYIRNQHVGLTTIEALNETNFLPEVLFYLTEWSYSVDKYISY